MNITILKMKVKLYLRSYYFIFQHRPNKPVDTPPTSLSEEIAIGYYIRRVKYLEKWFKEYNFDIPVYLNNIYPSSEDAEEVAIELLKNKKISFELSNLKKIRRFNF